MTVTSQPRALSGSADPAEIDELLWCFLAIAQFHGMALSADQLLHEMGVDRLTMQGFLIAAKRQGLSARRVHMSSERVSRAPLPMVCVDKAGKAFLVAKVARGEDGVERILIQRPGKKPEILNLAAFAVLHGGPAIYVASRASALGELARFDFTWFMPAIVKYRRLFGEVLAVSLALQLIGLCTPMFFQVVMDKVLVNRALSTLNVISLGLALAVLFEVILSAIRSYVFAHASSKIDVELGARLFRHLLALPLRYFHSRRVGDSVARVRELENIRAFLTGNALTLVLDIVFSGVFLAVMWWYSPKLTWIVLLSLPAYVILSIAFTPAIRRRLDEQFNRGADSQSFLVESVTAMDTVKAMAVEPQLHIAWEKKLAAYVTTGLAATNTSVVANAGVTLVSKVVTVLITWQGAHLVMGGELTIGELVAFNMLAGQVSSPILRIAQLWNEFQHVAISMARLGDILNTRTEIASTETGARTQLPMLEGAVELDQVSFRYRPDAPDVLRSISLSIRPGEIIGLVGRSGSGKSTLTKLIQRLYLPDRGRVLIDGHDIAIVDTASLRRQIGVVLQETILFRRSIRDNIALAKPSAPIDDVIAAAKLAGAHEFICEQAEGYDTLVGEYGTGLSGGQRQRIAIARALMTNPRILIFDEATSALDYESEAIVQENMRHICVGRTVIIIAHRLSAVRHANRIAVIDRGQVVEIGSHAELLEREDGIYRGLHDLQSGLHRASDAFRDDAGRRGAGQ